MEQKEAISFETVIICIYVVCFLQSWLERIMYHHKNVRKDKKRSFKKSTKNIFVMILYVVHMLKKKTSVQKQA